MARQAQWAGGPVSPCFRVGGAPDLVETATEKIELDPIGMEE